MVFYIFCKDEADLLRTNMYIYVCVQVCVHVCVCVHKNVSTQKYYK